MDKSSQRHLKWIDLVRVIAIVCVLICHSVELLYGEADLNNFAFRVYIFICFAFGRLGVPLFLMITGYLLLDRHYDEAVIKRFWTKKWLNLLACTGIWFLIYEVFLFATGRGTADPVKLIQELVITKNIDLPQTWYMGMILAVYILIPFVAIAINSVDKKLLLFPFIIFFVYEFGRETLDSFIEFIKPEYMMNTQFVSGFSGGVWGIYVVTGYLLKKGILKKINNIILIMGLLVSLVVLFVFMMTQTFFGTISSLYVWYDNIFVFTGSLMLFELLSRIPDLKGTGYKLIRFVAKYTFPVFLTHSMIMILLLPVVNKIPADKAVKSWMLIAAGLGIGLGISKLLAMIPKAGRFITYVKE